MDIQVRGKGVVVTEAMRDYATRRVEKLTNHFRSLQNATVWQSVQGQTHKVEVLLEGDGLKVRCEQQGSDLYAATDQVVDKLERQMQKFKRGHRMGCNNHRGEADGHHNEAVWAHHHHYGKHGEIASIRTAPTIDDLEPEEPVTGRIVKHKRFDIKPLSQSEAVEAMELLSHDFFVFQNAKTGEVNVLYRRNDENYGVLEPEH